MPGLCEIICLGDSKIVESKSMKKSAIVKYLDDVGMRHSVIGFDYLVTAIDMCVEKPERAHKICKLYDDVTEIHNTIGSRVERAIRHAIETADNVIGYEDGRIPNGEFIARASDYFIYQEENKL